MVDLVVEDQPEVVVATIEVVTGVVVVFIEVQLEVEVEEEPFILHIISVVYDDHQNVYRES